MIHLVLKTESRLSNAKACMTFRLKLETEFRPCERACVVMHDVFGSGQNNQFDGETPSAFEACICCLINS